MFKPNENMVEDSDNAIDEDDLVLQQNTEEEFESST
jgi:hypothetical protein